MVRMPRFETSCLEMGVKTLVTETGQQLPPSSVWLFHRMDQMSFKHIQHGYVSFSCDMNLNGQKI